MKYRLLDKDKSDDYYGSNNKDLIRIQNLCLKNNIIITKEQALKLWDKHSEDYCACWLMLDDNDETLWGIIEELIDDLFIKEEIEEKE